MLQTQHVRNNIVVILFTAQWCRKGTSLMSESKLFLSKENCLHRSFQFSYHTYRNAIGTSTYFCDITDFYATRCAEAFS